MNRLAFSPPRVVTCASNESWGQGSSIWANEGVITTMPTERSLFVKLGFRF